MEMLMFYLVCQVVRPLSKYQPALHPSHLVMICSKNRLMILTYARLLSSSRETCQTPPPSLFGADSPTLRTLWHGWDDLQIVNGLLVKGLYSVNGSLSEYVFFLQA